MTLSPEIKKKLLAFQKNELTEHHIYTRLARMVKSPENREVLENIAADELRHSREWQELTGQEIRPATLKVWWYVFIGRVFGYTFGIKLMEQGESGAQKNYAELSDVFPQVVAFIQDEHKHEQALIDMLDEERLRYVGSIVLGLNDALVELTGVLAGLTLALQDTRLIALTGSITGIAAALSMAASEYISTKTEDTTKDPIRASIYTGSAYILTVVILILPYLFIQNYFICLALTLIAAVMIIAFFNYYISVAKDIPFKSRFLEMTGLSLGVATISFVIGYLVRTFLGVDV